MIDRLTEALADRYRIERELGEGGMATVYLAQDLKHDREVAIKVLKSELAAVIGAERFLTEIRTTANLQHPHILPLFDSGQADHFLYYVMPFVRGESLRERIDRDKQLPVDEAVKITVAVAGALDYAHRQGVVHRDIKPANILLQDGQPVVADFGIALAVQNAGAGRMTETGLSLGTPHYMSPEQASADRDITAQSDVYALACVAYEMLTGGPPFSAPTAQAVLMQILTEDARPVTKVRKSTPPHVEAAVARALEKLPADRFASAAAFGEALLNPGWYTPPRVGVGQASSRTRWLWPAAAAAMAVLAIWGWVAGDPPPESRGLVGFQALPDGVNVVDVTEGARLAFSPDGRAIAFISASAGGLSTVFVRDLSNWEPRAVWGTQVSGVAFHADSRSLIVREGDQIIEVPLGGGATRTLAIDAVIRGPLTADADGSVFYLKSEGGLARLKGGTATTMPPPQGAWAGEVYTIVQMIEGGDRALAFVSNSAGAQDEFGILDLESGEVGVLGQGTPIALRDGIVVWEAQGTVFAARVDPSAGRLIGTQVSVMEEVDLGASLSAAGDLAYLVAGQRASALVRVDRSGARDPLDINAPSVLGIRLSPDGAMATFVRGFSVGTPDVYVVDLSTGVETRLTFDGGIYSQFSRDGDRVAYYRQVEGDYAMYTRRSDASGEEEVLLDTETTIVDVDFVPGSNRIVVREGDQARLDGSDIFLYEAGNPDSRSLLAGGPGNQLSPAVSPDGRFVAYSSDELGGGTEVFVRSLANPNQRWQVSSGGGGEPAWNPDGSELFYLSESEFVAVPVDIESDTFRRTGTAITLFSALGLLENRNRRAYDVAPDGQSFLFLSAGSASINVVLNWWDEVVRLVGEN